MLETNTVGAGDERICHWTRTHLSLEMKAFIAGDEGIYRWRRRRLALEANTFSAGDERIENGRVPCILSVLSVHKHWYHPA